VILRDGHTYERHAAEEWLRDNHHNLSSYVTGKPMHGGNVVPNKCASQVVEQVKSIMADLLAAMTWVDGEWLPAK